MGAISSLRILPTETDSGSLRPSTQPKTGFSDVLHTAMDDMQQLQGQAAVSYTHLTLPTICSV